MGVDLIGRGMSVNWNGWHQMLALAAAFGWDPQGTMAPDDFERQWDGTYCSNDFQRVTDADARNIGLALHRALDAARNEMPLTQDQEEALNGVDLSYMRELADVMHSPGFTIG